LWFKKEKAQKCASDLLTKAQSEKRKAQSAKRKAQSAKRKRSLLNLEVGGKLLEVWGTEPHRGPGAEPKSTT